MKFGEITRQQFDAYLTKTLDLNRFMPIKPAALTGSNRAHSVKREHGVTSTAFDAAKKCSGNLLSRTVATA